MTHSNKNIVKVVWGDEEPPGLIAADSGELVFPPVALSFEICKILSVRRKGSSVYLDNFLYKHSSMTSATDAN